MIDLSEFNIKEAIDKLAEVLNSLFDGLFDTLNYIKEYIIDEINKLLDVKQKIDRNFKKVISIKPKLNNKPLLNKHLPYLKQIYYICIDLY